MRSNSIYDCISKFQISFFFIKEKRPIDDYHDDRKI